MKSPNTSLRTIKVNPSCSWQAHSKRPSTGPDYESMEPGYIFNVFRVPSVICPLRSTDAKYGKVI